MNKESQVLSIELSEFGSHAFKLLQEKYIFLTVQLSKLPPYSKQILDRQLVEFHESLWCELIIYKKSSKNSLIFQELENSIVNVFVFSDGKQDINFNSINFNAVPEINRALYKILERYISLLEKFIKEMEVPRLALSPSETENVKKYKWTGVPTPIKKEVAA